MKVSVNDEPIETAVIHLSDLLDELDYKGEWLATAVNAELVTAEERGSYQLQEGDRIEILSPMQGG